MMRALQFAYKSRAVAVRAALPSNQRGLKAAPVEQGGALAVCPVILAPGLNGSAQDHWQSEWQRLFPRFARIGLEEWHVPEVDRWAKAILEAVLKQEAPAIVVAHSFGCLGAIQASVLRPELVAGILLVAPPDPARFGIEQLLQQLVPPCPTVLVASETDDWMTTGRAWYWALQWGSQLVSLGAAGHINAASGHHEWHQGLSLLKQICRRVAV